MKRLTLVLICTITLFCSCKKSNVASVSAKADSLVYQTDFSTNDGSWPTFNINRFKSGYINGTYQIEIDSVNLLQLVTAPDSAINFEYSYSADCTIELDDTTQIGSAGLIFNKVGDNFMLFRIYNDGTYILYEIQGGEYGAYTTLEARKASADIKKYAGDVNNLKVVQRSNTVAFYINGNEQISISNVEYPGNVQVGLFAANDLAVYYKVTGVFDNVNISKVF
jgi:hypothetical protein